MRQHTLQEATGWQTTVPHLDGLPSVSQLVDLIENDAVVLVALGHVCSCCCVDILPKFLQNDLAMHTITGH